jgi:hypothetical protein
VQPKKRKGKAKGGPPRAGGQEERFRSLKVEKRVWDI